MGRPLMRCSRLSHAILVAGSFVAAALASMATGVRAQPVQVVNICGSDDASGGLNLATALVVGGPVSIQCPAGHTEIQFTRTHTLPAGTTIEGVGTVTLKGPSSGPMFKTSGLLQLSNLTVTGSAAAGSIVAGANATVRLSNVVVQDSGNAFLVRSIRAENSRFLNNGDGAEFASGGGVLSAETIELVSSEFVDNGDHPIAGGAWHTPDRVPLSRRVTIDKTTFAGNTSSILLIDARVTIRASRFIENGRKPDAVRHAWDCCGGAITMVRSDVEVYDSDFNGNGSYGSGGAIHSISSRLTVGRSTFADNGARVGGAIMSWAKPPRVNIWSTDDWTDLPRLVLTGVTFMHNKADLLGGAIAFAGPLQADGLVFRANKAQLAGGAIAVWDAAPLPTPYEGVMAALVDNTLPHPADRLLLTRAAFTENSSGGGGAAAALGNALSAIGNVIIARNFGVAALSAARLRLVNAVVADNGAAGIEPFGAGAVSLGNSAVFGNAPNCAASGTVAALGPNLQYPGSDCGTQIQSADPGLDGSYAPALLSAARDAGDLALCVSDPVVAGIDIYGNTRIRAGQVCSIGAVERDLVEAVSAGLTFDKAKSFGNCLMWLLLLLVLLVFLFALFTRWWKFVNK